MPMLALGGVTIPLVLEPLEADVENFDDEAPAHDGTLNTRRRAQKDTWTLRTRWLTDTEASAIRAALMSEDPVAATGDLVGSTSVIVRIRRKLRHTLAGGERRWSYEFTVREV